MSALEVIEQIKALPPAERRKVADFVRELDAPTGGGGSNEDGSARIAEDGAFEKAVGRVFEAHDELFRRLAQ